MKKTIEIECPACNGSGVYQGFAEPEGVAVVCVQCNGTGKTTFTYNEFQGRNRRRGISIVRRSAGTFIGIGVGPTGGSVSYTEFLNGKMPQNINKDK